MLAEPWIVQAKHKLELGFTGRPCSHDPSQIKSQADDDGDDDGDDDVLMVVVMMVMMLMMVVMMVMYKNMMMELINFIRCQVEGLDGWYLYWYILNDDGSVLGL